MLFQTWDFSSLQLSWDLPVLIRMEGRLPPLTFPERTNRSSHRWINAREPYSRGEEGGMDAYTPLSTCSNNTMNSSSLLNDKRFKLGALPSTENNKYNLTAKKASPCIQSKQLSGEASSTSKFSLQPTPQACQHEAGRETSLWKAADESEAAHQLQVPPPKRHSHSGVSNN